MKLENNDFLQIIAKTPLVSIDLIVRDERDRILLGLRRNKPAQGYWFVPGGRIFKDERISQALARIGREELGFPLSADGVRFMGVFEHLYKDNFAGEPGVSTHYVVLGCEVLQRVTLEQLPKSQHSDWRFWDIDELMASGEVHKYAKAYFEENPHTLALK